MYDVHMAKYVPKHTNNTHNTNTNTQSFALKHTVLYGTACTQKHPPVTSKHAKPKTEAKRENMEQTFFFSIIIRSNAPKLNGSCESPTRSLTISYTYPVSYCLPVKLGFDERYTSYICRRRHEFHQYRDWRQHQQQHNSFF